MLTSRTDKARWRAPVGVVAALLIAAFIVTVVLAMTVAPKDGCGSWPEQLNFLETSDLCTGPR